MPVATWENLTIGTRACSIRWTFTDWGRKYCRRPATTSRVRWINRRSLPSLILLRKYRLSLRLDDTSSLRWPFTHIHTLVAAICLTSVVISTPSRALEFISPSSRSRDLGAKSRSWSRERSDKVSFTAGCSRFYVNVLSTQKTEYISRLVGCRYMDIDNSLNSLLTRSKKMYCMICFKLLCVFQTVVCKYCYKCQGLDPKTWGLEFLTLCLTIRGSQYQGPPVGVQ